MKLRYQEYGMIQSNRLFARSFFAVLFTILMACQVQMTNAASPANIKSKAASAQQQLRQAVDEGKDVSKIVPKMKQVKVLGDQGKLDEVDALLDDILSDFDELNGATDKQNSNVATTGSNFQNPKEVEIVGYKKGAMEPFISHDGKYLFFNNFEKDTPDSEKNIYYAERINDTKFKFMGEVKGINSTGVDAVPTMDRNGNFYYVSVANYYPKNKFATVYSGKFKNGRVTNIKMHPELSLNSRGWLNMDIEISPNGKSLYATQTFFNFSKGGPPKKSYFFVAHRNGDTFTIDKRSDKIFKKINTKHLEYAASISDDELEILFTRLNTDKFKYTSYRATRPDKESAFSEPVKIQAITGVAEAPALSSDGTKLYFHKSKRKDKFVLYLLEREAD